MADKSFDLIVIGTGSGGSVAAGKCAKAGWEVAQVDSRPFGGTCALRGCDPKKVLVGAAELIDRNRRMAGDGISGHTAIAWEELMAFKRTFTEPVPENREKGMKQQGITPFHGRARFVGEQTIQVEDETLSADHLLIAAGAKPAPIPVEGFEHLTTSTRFLELDELPDTLVFVGGGYISFEFAHIAARVGSLVHIVHRGERPLEGFDPDMVDILLEKTDELGIKVHLNAEVTSVSPISDGYEVKTNGNGRELALTGGLVVHGAGRVPDIDDMELNKANIKQNKKGILVNEYLQSPGNPRVYAAGDAAASPGKPLTPVAGYESHIVASNLLKDTKREAEYPAQPTSVFSVPPLAAIGLTQEEAEEQGYEVEVNTGRTDGWYSSKRTNESHSAYKVLVDKKTDHIVGAHLLGEHAPELINLLTIAVNKNITTRELKQMIFAYPTNGSNLQYMI